MIKYRASYFCTKNRGPALSACSSCTYLAVRGPSGDLRPAVRNRRLARLHTFPGRTRTLLRAPTGSGERPLRHGLLRLHLHHAVRHDVPAERGRHQGHTAGAGRSVWEQDRSPAPSAVGTSTLNCLPITQLVPSASVGDRPRQAQITPSSSGDLLRSFSRRNRLFNAFVCAMTAKRSKE